ncbi:MAG: SUMF1/EgtB/PvdO family nonheme iron enzyme [Verrucomicrobia bacterium]|nr:SUMF1/EgtB/PvdO family nonheme iron enzyme [Verrucomicrobiota bacterium]
MKSNFLAIIAVKHTRFLALLANMLAAVSTAHAEISPGELVAPKMEISSGNVIFTVQPSVSGRNYQLQYSDSMAGGTWTDVGVVRSGNGDNLLISTPYTLGGQRRFYRVALVEATPAPAGFSLISAGSYEIGQTGIATPVHTVYVSAFYMANYEVTKALWDEVRTWAVVNGYANQAVGEGKASTHPVHGIYWWEMVKWCNARSEKEGLTPCYTLSGAVYRTGVSDAPVCDWTANGYRLPTEAEWEKAARGGGVVRNFPWGDTISHSQANYHSNSYQSYDVSSTRGYHPTYNDGVFPYTSPVGSFAPNGYGLHDMTGNVSEWCWDCPRSYTSVPQVDPKGIAWGLKRVIRGGDWARSSFYARCAGRFDDYPGTISGTYGFRPVRNSVP